MILLLPEIETRKTFTAGHMTVVCDTSKFLGHKLLIPKYFYDVAYE